MCHERYKGPQAKQEPRTKAGDKTQDSESGAARVTQSREETRVRQRVLDRDDDGAAQAAALHQRRQNRGLLLARRGGAEAEAQPAALPLASGGRRQRRSPATAARTPFPHRPDGLGSGLGRGLGRADRARGRVPLRRAGESEEAGARAGAAEMPRRTCGHVSAREL